MPWLVRFLWAFALLVSPIAGCNEVTAPTTAPLTLTVTGRLVADEPVGPVEGLQVCETDTSNCMTTDEDGEATINLPIGETSYTLRKKGHPSYLVGEVLPANGAEHGFGMGLEQGFVDQHENMMSPYPMTGTGTVELGLVNPFAGATFELMGATGRAYYAHEQGGWRPEPDLTATTNRGKGGFVEVPPGDDFRVNLGGTAHNCVPDLGWPGENSVRFPVRENHITWVGVSCSLPPTVQLFVTIEEAVDGFIDYGDRGPSLEGVEACETDTINCATSDVNGEARLTLPRNQPTINLTVTKDGYAPYLTGDVMTDLKRRRTFMVSDAQMADLAEDLMIEYPLTGGIVALHAWPATAGPGVTYDLVDETAKGYYNDEAGIPTLGLAATTANSGGGFLEVPQGEYQIEFGGTATTCIPGGAWPGDAANRIKVPVKVAHVTYGSMFTCDER